MDFTDLLPVTNCKDGTDAEMLSFALDRVRAQFAWKTGRLDAEQLRRQLRPSTMTLAGLIKHMAMVEDGFTAGAYGRELGAPWDAMDWAATDRWAWQSAVTDDPGTLYGLWYGAVERSRIAWQELIDDGGLDALIAGDGASAVGGSLWTCWRSTSSTPATPTFFARQSTGLSATTRLGRMRCRMPDRTTTAPHLNVRALARWQPHTFTLE